MFDKNQEFKDILGQKSTKQGLKSALILGRHIVICGPPGVGKTTLAKNVAKSLPTINVNDCGFNCDSHKPLCPKCTTQKVNSKKISGEQRFVRIQGSPDLTVEDLLGDIDPIKALKFGPLSVEAFTPGKIFKANNGILFFDELNRCPEKLQNALLQVLSEGIATIGSHDIDFPANFLLIATMNPEDSNTEQISDVLLDRFDILYMDYPESFEIEEEIVKLKGWTKIEFPQDLLDFVVEFVRLLRINDKLEKKPSVRATIGLYERAQANAILRDAEQVIFEDIQNAMVSVLAHRIRLKPSAKYLKSPVEFLGEEFKKFSDKKGKISDGL